MQCAKCGGGVSPAMNECPACGVILAKASSRRPAHPPVAPTTAATAAPPTRSFPLFKIAIAIVLIGGALMYLRPKPVAAAASPWYEDARGYEQAMAVRNDTGKPVMVYFHTTWCGFCKAIDRDVFSTAEFSQRYGSMLKVRINPESGRDEGAIATRYLVRGYPSVFVVTPDGTRKPIVGYRDAASFYADLADALAN